MNETSETLRVRVETLESEIAQLEERLETGRARPPREVVHTREVAGTIGEEALEEMVSILRREFGSLGEMERVGSTLTWSLRLNPSAGITRPLAVTIESRAGRTRIRMTEDLQPLFANRVAGWTVGMGFLGIAVLAGALAAINPGLAALSLLTPIFTHQLARRSYQKAAATAKQRGSDIMDTLAEVAREMAIGGVRVGAPETVEALEPETVVEHQQQEE